MTHNLERVLEKMVKETEQKGIEKGIEKGIKEGKIMVVKNMLRLGIEMEMIAKSVEMELDEIQKFKEEIEKEKN